MRQQRYEVSAADRGWIEQIGWRSVQDVLALASGGLAAVSNSSDVVQVPIDPALGGPTQAFVKRYRCDQLDHRIKQAFRGTLFGKSRAHREFEILTEMHRRQIPVVRPIAYGEKYGSLFLRASFLITEGTEGLCSLDLFAIDALRRTPLSQSQRQRLTQELAVAIRQMHDAGVRHGGLFWRNILVGERPGGDCDFLFLDPDTKSRLRASRVPETDAVSDLSEVVASALALGLRKGLALLMKSYFQVKHLTAEQKRMTTQIVESARPLVKAESRRMVTTEAIGWLRQRATSDPSCAVGSLDEFFGRFSSGGEVATPTAEAAKVIRFLFPGENKGDIAIERTLVVDGDRVTIGSHVGPGQDLAIRTDAETWLALVSGHEDAHARLRAGRLRLNGDTALLCVLMEHLDRTDSTPRPSDSTTAVT